MKVQSYFIDPLSYGASMEASCNKMLEDVGGKPMEFTFAADFAIADWYGAEDVKETYKRVIKEWNADYKALTEVVMALNLLSWVNVSLQQAGFEDRDDFIKLYSRLYYDATNEFYKEYGEDAEKCDYFFRMTD